MANGQVKPFSLLTEFDIDLFQSGKHYKLYEKFGAHEVDLDGVKGIYFAVWAPNAKNVSVIGDFNYWSQEAHSLFVRWDSSGVWEGFIPELSLGETYKYAILTQQEEILEKGDPFAFSWEIPPATASKVTSTWYEWNDAHWQELKKTKNSLDQPWSVYEMHLGSWRRDPQQPDRFLNYREIADLLIPYLKNLHFTHVEFMPIMEHPYYPSWGYQITGYYAATARYGSPQDLMYLIDVLHQHEIGVILDWVPSHFPGDAHGLHRFDGTYLYEHEDPRKGFHPDWQSYIFNYGRNEIKSFLISNAFFWLDRYHIDGLRVDAVASMLYLDYSRKEGEWIPNEYGGNENLEAVRFLKEFNEAVYTHFPHIQTIAEESTSWPRVSKPTFLDGLGFGMKWMMGWMHDTLTYFKNEPIYRSYHHNLLTFATVYAFHENFMLPLSHDEVVYGKESMLYKMPGDEWQKYANLKALYLYMYTFSGTKLLFMGSEFGQTAEWNVNQSLDWHLLDYFPHQGLLTFFQELNTLYVTEKALYSRQFHPDGFQWLDSNDQQQSVYVYVRKDKNQDNDLIILLNLTPVPRDEYRFGVLQSGIYEVLLNSDDHHFYGSGYSIQKEVQSDEIHWMGQKNSIQLDLPPLCGLILKRKKTENPVLTIQPEERTPIL